MASKTTKQLRRLIESVMQSSKQDSTKQQKRSRKGRSRRVAKLENRLGDIQKYVKSIYDDVVVGNCELPSPDYIGPYRRHQVTGRFQLNLANTASLHASVVVNPWLMWTNNFVFEKVFAGAPVTATVPTIYQHSLTSTAAGLPTGGNLISCPLEYTLNTSSTSSWSGKVRCTGVHFRIYYTGTFANRGGMLLAFTNSQNQALATQSETGAAAAQPTTVFDTSVELSQLARNVQMIPIGDEFSFTWRPTDLSFREFNTFVPNILDGIVGTNGNVEVSKYLPDNGVGGSQAEMGWVTGFELRPAAGTQGTASQYFCEVSAEYDLVAYNDNNSSGTAGLSAYAPDRRAKVDPIAHARASNALADLHHKRTTLQFPAGAKSLAVRAEGMLEKYGGKIARNTAVEAIGARMAAML